MPNNEERLKEGVMAVEHGTIAWKRDINDALNQARQLQRGALLDFSAAPM
jgi:hypothetical protein